MPLILFTHTQRLSSKVSKLFFLVFPFFILFLAVSHSSVMAFTCGDNLTINHTTSGGVAPVDKTVTYGTVLTDLTGEDMCWITQNLGAKDQASSATDSDEDSAGWYWQFNKKQGYKYDTSRTPNTTWISDINEDSNWTSADDPCALELGTGWRLPTNSELSNVYTNGGWSSVSDSYNSDLKIHAAGFLDYYTGNITLRGVQLMNWSATQASYSYGYFLYCGYGCDTNEADVKAEGFSVRCLHDAVFPTPTSTPTTTPVSQTSSNSPSSSAPSCTAQANLFAPDLFQIDMTKTKTTLWYAPVPDPVTSYFIAYGTDKDNLQHGVEYCQGYSSGVLSYTINQLLPNTIYYFIIRAGNGCMPGTWDSLFKAKSTKSEISIKKYYRYCLFHRLCIN